MAAGQKKLRLFVAGQRERGRLVSLQGVATFATIEIRCSGELAIMLVPVAVGAMLKLDLEESVFAFGDMTLRAFDIEVLALERIRRCRVVFRGKGGRLEALDRVAG